MCRMLGVKRFIDARYDINANGKVFHRLRLLRWNCSTRERNVLILVIKNDEHSSKLNHVCGRSKADDGWTKVNAIIAIRNYRSYWEVEANWLADFSIQLIFHFGTISVEKWISEKANGDAWSSENGLLHKLNLSSQHIKHRWQMLSGIVSAISIPPATPEDAA